MDDHGCLWWLLIGWWWRPICALFKVSAILGVIVAAIALSVLFFIGSVLVEDDPSVTIPATRAPATTAFVTEPLSLSVEPSAVIDIRDTEITGETTEAGADDTELGGTEQTVAETEPEPTEETTTEQTTEPAETTSQIRTTAAPETEPTTPAPVTYYYSTNTGDAVKDGDKGVYAYKRDGASIDQYYIVDLDEGYAYFFTDGGKGQICERARISSGDLNSGAVVAYHSGGTSWSNTLVFKTERTPDELIVRDKNGAEYAYHVTDLKNALDIRSAKTISDRF